MQPQGLGHQLAVDEIVAPHRRHIPDTPEQAIGDPGRATATTGHLLGRIGGQIHQHQTSGPFDDRPQIVEAVELQAMQQTETVTQG